MDTIADFLNWAWARHHNPLSWYIRPLFILPFCYFAYQKSARGMLVTVVAVTSSMFWFPAPASPDPTAATFLAVEREWITGPLTWGRLVMTALIPIWFIALAAAVRRRLWVAVAVVIASGTALKIAWSFYVGGTSAWIIVPPVALGNAICAGVLIYVYRRGPSIVGLEPSNVGSNPLGTPPSAKWTLRPARFQKSTSPRCRSPEI